MPRFRSMFILLAFLFLAALPALADQRQDLEMAYQACKGGHDDVCIELTTKLLSQGNLAPDATSILYERRGTAWAGKNNQAAMMSDYQAALAHFSNNYYVYLNRGRYYLSKKQYDSALEDFSQALKLKPSYGPLYGYRGRVYFHQGLNDKAKRDYDQCLALSPKWPLIYGFRADYWLRFKKNDNAIAELETMHKLAPHAEVVTNLLHKLKRQRSATQAAKKLKPNQPLSKMAAPQTKPVRPNESWEKIKERADKKYKAGQYAESLKLLDMAIARGPKQKKKLSSLLADRAAILVKLERYEDAVKAATKALRLDPKNTHASVSEAHAQYNQGNKRAAFKTLNKAIKKNPTSAYAYFSRGSLHKNDKKWANALADLQKALELDPDDPNTLLQMSSVYFATGQPGLAKKHLILALSSKKLPPEMKARTKQTLGILKGKTDSIRMAFDKEKPSGPKKAEEAAKTPRGKLDGIMNSVVVLKTGTGLGSGFVVDSEGHIITNQHVVGDSSEVKVIFRDGREAKGLVLTRRKDWDLALVLCQVKSKRFLKLARTTQGAVGTEVLAVGAPKGLSWTVSKGIVSAIRDHKGLRIIQTDAPINPGNSGGPLILKRSRMVVGVNTFIIKQSDGLGFAVSAYNVCQAFPQFCPGKGSQASVENTSSPAPATSGKYHGSTASMVFHRPGCRYYNCSSCKAGFPSREEAINAGYRPCKICKP